MRVNAYYDGELVLMTSVNMFFQGTIFTYTHAREEKTAKRRRKEKFYVNMQISPDDRHYSPRD